MTLQLVFLALECIFMAGGLAFGIAGNIKGARGWTHIKLMWLGIVIGIFFMALMISAGANGW